MLQKVERSPSKGYQLVDLGPLWEIHSPRGIYKGSFRQVCTYAALELGFSLDEFDVAVQEMEKHFHNCAEFGIYKSFLYTCEVPTKGELH
jgi:hypothetical protein